MIRAIIALLASVFTATQIYFLYTGEKSLCFNNGCDIVDAMTIFSPLLFNIVGFIYFQALFWFLLWGRKGSENWHKLAGLLLLAGLGAEAVFIFFQYSIAGVFCSYCMVIFALVVLLNLFFGLKQMVRGAVLFSAVIIACFSLQFKAGATSGLSLDNGTLARLAGSGDVAQHYLFFSASCGHCEQVIGLLANENTCDVRFNPVETIENFQFAGAVYAESYAPQVNYNFLKSLSITEVPVLLVRNREETRVLKGEQRIQEYLGENCRQVAEADFSGTSNMKLPGYTYIPDSSGQPAEDACTVATDCAGQESGSNSGKQ